MSTPQEPHQPGQSESAPQQQPAPQPPQQQPAQPSSAPQYAGVQPSPEGPYQGQHQGHDQYAPPAQYGAPGYHPGPFGLPGQPPPAKSRKVLWIILGSVGAVLLLVIVGVIVLVNVVGSATSQARGLADDFTRHVISGDTDKAYDFLDPGLHDELTKESFVEGITSLELNDTCKPTYNDVKVSSKNGANSADVAGFITCDGDKKVELAYRFEGQDELKLINIKLRPQG